MTDAPALSMQSSLASLEARRNGDEPRNYLDKATVVLVQVRNKTIETDTAWRRQRATMRDEIVRLETNLAALKDDLVRLDDEHNHDMARLADMERRLEIIRGEVV